MEDLKKSRIIGFGSLVSAIGAWVALDQMGIFRALYNYKFATMNVSQWIGLILFAAGVGVLLSNLALHNLSPEDMLDKTSELMQRIGGLSEEEANKKIQQAGKRTKAEISKRLVHYASSEDRTLYPPPLELARRLRSLYYNEISLRGKVFAAVRTPGSASRNELRAIPPRPATSSGLESWEAYNKSINRKVLAILGIAALVYVLAYILNRYYGGGAA